MADKPQIQFGRRRPHRLPDAPPTPAPKRSRHVALLVMGTMAVGGGAYALMERPNCQPSPPAAAGIAAPAQPQGSCTSRGSSSGGGTGNRWSSFHFYGGGDSSSSSRGSSSGVAESGSVSRGGFGGFGHAFGFGGG